MFNPALRGARMANYFATFCTYHQQISANITLVKINDTCQDYTFKGNNAKNIPPRKIMQKIYRCYSFYTTID